jgi:peptidyl-prolyl cis-trans isomerase D
MISWIQRTFQHHFRLIFAVLLIGMVIPFIFTIGSTPGIGRAERATATREFFGHNLLSQEETRKLVGDTRISAELQYGTTNVSQEQIEYYMYQRIAAKHLAEQLHLPAPNTEEITDFIKGLRMFEGADGKFDVTRYDAFRSSLKADSATSEADIARVISDDAQMNKLQKFLAGPGYVTPGDVKQVLDKGDTTWTLSTATVAYSDFPPAANPTDAELTKFFADNTFRYTVAPRAVVEAVRFPLDNYLAGINPTDAEIREYYDSNRSKFPKPPVPKPADPKAPAPKDDPEADYAKLQPAVKAALVKQLATQAAVRAASDLAYALYEGKVDRASVDAFLAGRSVKAESLAPFTKDAGPAELGGSHAVATAAFELNADHFYSEGIAVPTGAVLLIWKDQLASHEPLLAEVRDKVLADAKDSQRRTRFIEFGRTLKAGIESRLKSGEAFDKAASEAAGDVKVAVKSFPPFTLRKQNHDVDPSVYSVLDRLDKGAVSDMGATADKGVIVYAADKKEPVTDESNPRYAEIKAQIASQFARTDATSVMREIVQDELKRSESAVK